MSQQKDSEKTAISDALRELGTLTFDMQGRLSLDDYMRLRALKRQADAEYQALSASESTRSRLVKALEGCDKAFAAWQVGQIPGRPEDILALITDVRAALSAAHKGEDK